MTETSVLRVENLVKHFPIRKGIFARAHVKVHAVNGVSFQVKQGETFALIGESGCGKTTVGRLILRLIEPDTGTVFFREKNLRGFNARKMPEIRRRIQMIFQNPFASLNPRMKIREIIGEPLDIHQLAQGGKREERIYELLNIVGLHPELARRYPHELSGGQRQRVGIARALAVEPELIVCDEMLSFLDISTKMQIVAVLKNIQQKFGVTYLFISHDLSLIEEFAHQTAVMYLGKIVEIAPTLELFTKPLHPYTQALLHSRPLMNPETGKDPLLFFKGEAPNTIEMPKGCYFHTRCPNTTKRCSKQEPSLIQINGKHKVVCHQYNSFHPGIAGNHGVNTKS